MYIQTQIKFEIHQLSININTNNEGIFNMMWMLLSRLAYYVTTWWSFNVLYIALTLNYVGSKQNGIHKLHTMVMDNYII